MTTPSVIKKRLATWQYVTQAVINGLNGDPFHWGGAEFRSYREKARAMGITLLTKTAIKKRGMSLKRGAKPVGSGYFYAPIARMADLYVMECQTVKRKEVGNVHPQSDS